jgi:hypothetical protein
MRTGIAYVDKEELPIYFFAMVIRVRSINRKVGSVETIHRLVDREMLTNGKMLVMFEMVYPPIDFHEIWEEFLKPKGFKIDKDLVFLEEQLIRGVDGTESCYLDEIPGSEEIPWLKIRVSEDGNYAWCEPAFDDVVL